MTMLTKLTRCQGVTQMQARFQPTGYVFEVRDEFFVEVGEAGTSRTVAAFEKFDDAKAFAEIVVKRPGVRAVYVFTRTQQVLSLYAERVAA